jgi:oxidase EvaA
MSRSDWLDTWLSEVGDRSQLRTSRISLEDSSEWSLIDGHIRHTSGRFFQVAGIRWRNGSGREVSQPLLIQREVGTLGFAKWGNELLVQAKVEPGNVGVVQLAPTCQATASNLDRVHGGKAPAFAKDFWSQNRQIVHDSLQSEQGSRFLQKLNRNVLAVVDLKLTSEDTHRWIPVDAVLEWSSTDFLVNTDARSVLVCSPWDLLTGRQPFSRLSTSFAKELALSYAAPNAEQAVQLLVTELQSLRAAAHAPLIVPLDEVAGWQLHDGCITPVSDGPFEIYQIEVHALGREVSKWDQPIMSNCGEGYVELICGRIDGLLHFLLTPQLEAGLYNMVELGPSTVFEPGESLPDDTFRSRPGATILAECRQSDEGGRFFRAVSTYRLIDIGDVTADLPKGMWLTLAVIRRLLAAGGLVTNEARSALSLALKWM